MTHYHLGPGARRSPLPAVYRLLPALLALTGCAPRPAKPAGPPSYFLVKPYLQIGRLPKATVTDERVLLWKTATADTALTAEFRPARGLWEPLAVRWTGVNTDPVPPYEIGSAEMTGLKLDSDYEYRLSRAGKVLFSSPFHTRVRPGTPYTFAIMGDCGAGTPAEKVLAVRLARAKPRFVLVPGDIVYDSGRERDYRPKFFDIYNADAPDPQVGAPLIRNTPFVGALGNHDVGGRDFSKGVDGLAYYYNFAQPLNGPNLGLGSAYLPHIDKETPAQRAAFMKAAGPNYPRMGNFSFEDGDVHFTLIDSDPYVDWRDPMLQTWLRQDLFHTNARWKIVLFHHPPFNASLTHLGDQQMRVLTPLFEQMKVDLVVAGHEHNYQRQKPLRFVPEIDPKTGKVKKEGSRVDGRLILDREYDGKTRTRPKYPLYIVTGAGGQRLYKTVFRWAAFFAASYSRQHSFSLVSVAPNRLLYRQINEDGREVDRFVVDKPAKPSPPSLPAVNEASTVAALHGQIEGDDLRAGGGAG